MQCKDIPDADVLRFLSRLSGRAASWHDLIPREEFMPTVIDAMPVGVDPRLALAKMKMLLRRGLVSGCGCGCRGEFLITDKGADFLVRTNDA